jgi:hypothetical protein
MDSRTRTVQPKPEPPNIETTAGQLASRFFAQRTVSSAWGLPDASQFAEALEAKLSAAPVPLGSEFYGTSAANELSTEEPMKRGAEASTLATSLVTIGIPFLLVFPLVFGLTAWLSGFTKLSLASSNIFTLSFVGIARFALGRKLLIKAIIFTGLLAYTTLLDFVLMLEFFSGAAGIGRSKLY